ncbi:Crp/Fnr family transcriptional regulator [Ramlibacter tataouinensis]|uniref:Crp/Fnr family transcriptional regulator n=1 Tax=Ramlibacter tataouinensis TaxID=94132 RepID=UPI0022F3AF65|nr:Crp/Fnr family transcriptional regulator [Ramlibacter tataouinensis]WBY00425.1 Crp/Fnr family transcriptional regulator [Ramlibacter tataouinensis]
MLDPAARDRLFSSLTAPIRSLALRGVVRSYRKNTILVQEGERGDSTFVLLQGKAKVYSNDAEGREIVYSVVGPGDYFAEMWLDGGPRCASVMTLEPCICAIVGSDDFRDHFARDPAFALELVSRLIRRVREATLKARELALLDVYGRVVRALEAHEGPAVPGRPVVLSPITHQAIASRVGSSREMVSRLLKDLERGGYLELGVKRITLRRKLPARW